MTRLSLDENENEKRWNSLPPLGEFNWISAAKPGAIVLASGFETKGNVILLAAHRYGRGRAMAFTAANSWLWQMEMPHTDDSHEVFWRQTLRWLAGSAPDPVELEFDRGVVGADEALHFNVEVKDDSFHKLNDAEVMTTITSPNGKTTDLPLPWIVKKDGVYSGEFKPSDQGAYSVHVKAVRQDKEVGKAEGFFLVADNHLEFYNAGQNQDLLRRITSETGGRYYTLASAENLPEEMTYTNRPNSVPQLLPLWDMPIVFISICLLLVLEWAGRKKEGLA